MKKKAPPQMSARTLRISQSRRFICARIMCASWLTTGAAASSCLRSNAWGSIGFMAGRMYGYTAVPANKCPVRVNKVGLSVAQQFIDAGLRAGTLVYALHDHGAGEGRTAVFRREATRHDH